MPRTTIKDLEEQLALTREQLRASRDRTERLVSDLEESRRTVSTLKHRVHGLELSQQRMQGYLDRIREDDELRDSEVRTMRVDALGEPVKRGHGPDIDRDVHQAYNDMARGHLGGQGGSKHWIDL